MLCGHTTTPARDDAAEPTRRQWETLTQALRGSARIADGAGVYVIDERGSQEFRTYAQLLENALRLGAALRLKGIEPRDRVMLLQSTGFPFLGAFFGAVAIGAVPVPFPPTSAEASVSHLEEPDFLETARRVGARAVIVDDHLRGGELAGAGGAVGLVSNVSTLLEGMPVGAVVEPQRSWPQTAYIQLTAGATGPMRGVQLTHTNILSNVRAIGAAIDVHSEDLGVSWIPPHNSMGLVGLICMGVYWGIDMVMLHPGRFLKRPEDWLRAISRHGGTLSTAPNFAYHYAVRRCQESNLKGLDLSSWRVAMSGAEPVRAQHMDAFLRRFGSYGLRRNVFMPVYGLAEATLGVTFGEEGAPVSIDGVNRRVLERDGFAEPLPDTGAKSPAERLHLVSVGRPLQGVDVKIVDEAGSDVGERRLGEVAVRGPCVMKGYIDDPDTPHTSPADGTRLDGDWLYTGDLGYVADGQLYVIGRACDAIETARGRSIFPEELELFVNSVDGVRAGSAAAFAVPVEDGGDDASSGPNLLVISYELQAGTEPTEVERAARALLSKHLSVDPHALVALSPGSVPKTHSGKVRRFLARHLYLDGRLERHDRHGELDAVRRIVARAQGEVARLGNRLYDRIEKLLAD